jgi:hypothetical protein
MTTRIGNGGAAVNTASTQQVEERKPLWAFPTSQPQAKPKEFRDGFESQGPRHAVFQQSAFTQPRADLKTVSLAELMRTGSESVPSTGEAERLVNEAYAEVLGREPDAGGAQMYTEKALEMAHNGASEDEIRDFLRQELAGSPEGQVKHPEAFLKEAYQSLLGRSADSEGLASFGAKMKELYEQGASLGDIQKAVEQDIKSSPEYQSRQAQQAPAGGSTPATGGGSSPASLKGITPSQINDAAGFSDQWSLCGPIAAVAASRATGKPVSLEEARNVAIQGGNYTPGDGMHGAESEVRLLKDLGIPSHTETPVNWDKVKEQVQSGKPVIISTPNHYFVVEGYNEATGKFDCGNSALAMKASGGTQTEVSPSELASWGGGTPTAIILD